MKNKVLCLFALICLFLFTVPAHAAFTIKKNVGSPATTVAANATTGSHEVRQVTVFQQVKAISQLATAKRGILPSFFGFKVLGWLAIISVICGVAGFLHPGFAILATMLGLIGMGRNNRKKGLAIAGFIMGLVVIGLVIFTGFTGIL
ncbi:MAG: hypothetical protein V4649_17195 [Bacteroidota bacterium]